MCTFREKVSFNRLFGLFQVMLCQVLQLLCFLELRVKIFRRDRSAPETHESGVCRTNGEGERGRALAVPIHTDMIILRARWWPGKGGRQFCCNPGYFESNSFCLDLPVYRRGIFLFGSPRLPSYDRLC